MKTKENMKKEPEKIKYFDRVLVEGTEEYELFMNGNL